MLQNQNDVGAWLAAVLDGTVAWSLLSASVDAPGGFWLTQPAGLLLSMSLTLVSWRPSATHQPALWAKCISCLSYPRGGENIFTDLVQAGAAYLSGDALRAVIHIGMTFRKVLVV